MISIFTTLLIAIFTYNSAALWLADGRLLHAKVIYCMTQHPHSLVSLAGHIVLVQPCHHQDK